MVRQHFAMRGESGIGTRILRVSTSGYRQVAAEYGRDLFRPGSELLAVSFDDDSLLIEGKRLRRTWTAVEVDGERLILNTDRFYDDPEESTGLNLSILTRDDL